MNPFNIRLRRRVEILCLVLIFLGTFSLVVNIVIRSFSDPLSFELERGSLVSTLFMVTGDDNTLLFSELLLYHPKTHQSALVFIPEQTARLITRGNTHRVAKISTLFRPSLPRSYVNEVASMLGLPIEFYVEISKQSLASVVDLVGGMPFFLTGSYDTLVNGKTVLLSEGQNYFDGDKMLQYLLTPSIDERDENQEAHFYQNFFYLFLRTLKLKENTLQSPAYRHYFKGLIHTNLDRPSFKAFTLRLLPSIDFSLMIQHVVGGDLRYVDSVLMLFPFYHERYIKKTVKEVLSSLSLSQTVASSYAHVPIEILNGTRRSGLASSTRRLLRSYGFQRVIINNAKENDVALTTITIYNREDYKTAQRLARLLGLTRIVEGVPSLATQAGKITVELGADFNGNQPS